MAVTRNAYRILIGNRFESGNLKDREEVVGIILICILERHIVRLGTG
jgi:hypothetical protein